MNISSPIATGNGAYIVHEVLSTNINNYTINSYNPYWTLFPFILSLLPNNRRIPDLIHTTADYAYFFKKKDIPMVITFHNYMLDPFMQQYSSILQRIHYQSDLKLFSKLAIKKANIITAVSQFTADLVKKELGYNKDIHIINNGVDENIFTPQVKKIPNKNEIIILFSGNLTTRKGAHWLPKIADLLPDNIKIICATGLRTKISDKFKHRKIEFREKVPYSQMPELYQSVDMLLMPTVREGHSLSILEAMSSGLPIIASNCSSIPEQVIHKKGGYLCDIGNVKQFSNSIIKLSEDRQKRMLMGKFNRQRILEHFTLEQMVQNYTKLFKLV